MTQRPYLELVQPRPMEAPAAQPSQPVQINDDDLLMAAAAAGDRTAFAALVCRYERDIRGFCTAVLRDPVLARDAAQDVFLKLWSHREHYQAQGKLREYVFTVARNVCRSKQRRHRVARILGLVDVEHSAIEDAPSLDDNAEAQWSSREHARMLSLALTRLEEKFRVPVVLRYVNGLSYDEIAVTIGRTPSAARSRVFYGLKQLAGLWPKEENR